MLKQYEPSGHEVDLLFHALADPSRRAMVDRLTRGPASVSELARPLEMSLPAVVQHLHVLEGSGLVSTQKVGRVRTCTMQPAVMQAAEQWIHERRTFWEEQLDKLGEFLEQDPAATPGSDQQAKRSKQ